MGPERYALLAGCDYTLLPSRCYCSDKRTRRNNTLEELTDVDISERFAHHGVVKLVFNEQDGYFGYPNVRFLGCWMAV